MLHKTRGIVLSHLKYKETSIIVNIYTETFGIQSYIENGVRSSRAKNKMALFQPLSLLDLVVYKKQNSSINRISELKSWYHYQSVPYQLTKSTIGIFLAELLSKLLRSEEESNPPLFNYIINSLQYFDHQETSFYNFHLKFLIGITQFLGFYPTSGSDLLQEVKPFIKVAASPEYETILHKIIRADVAAEVRMSGQERRDILHIIISFLQINISDVKEIKSLKVLHEVLTN